MSGTSKPTIGPEWSGHYPDKEPCPSCGSREWHWTMDDKVRVTCNLCPKPCPVRRAA